MSKLLIEFVGTLMIVRIIHLCYVIRLEILYMISREQRWKPKSTLVLIACRIIHLLKSDEQYL